MLHEHVSSRDSDICELRVSYDPTRTKKAYLNVTIIDTITSHLLSDITNIDPR
jgi:hypothetical protein